MAIDDQPAFERLPRETPKAFHCFVHYRDLPGHRRSLDVAWHAHWATCLHAPQPSYKRRSKTWAQWSRRWGWVARCDMFDLHLERERRRALETEQAEASKRHARVLAGALSTLSVPIRVALQSAATPEALSTLLQAAGTNAATMRMALEAAARMAALLPGLIASERLVLGLTTESHEIRDALQHDPIAQAITNDPEMTRLAIQLLDRVGSPRDGEALPASRNGARLLVGSREVEE